jgi:hypothetical protein
MPSISAPDLAIYRAGQPHVRRFLSVVPRTAVYSAVVSAVQTDPDTGGIHAIDFTGGSGTLADALPGFTLDIGSSAGARDVGMLRLRKAPVAGRFFVGETPPGACAVQIGHHLTARRERRPWGVLPRLVESGSPFADTFTWYADYDSAYTDQNDAVQPHANISADAAGNPVRPAGFVDAGQPYRTVTLSAVGSVVLAHGAAVTGYLWDVGDGTITAGTATSAAVTVRFPAGFRYIALTVTDSNGKSHTRFLPIWAHDGAYPPLMAFQVVNDVRAADAGRVMTIRGFGADGTWSAAAFPAGAAVCYWEDCAYGGSGTSAPASQTDSLLGWAMADAETLKIADRTVYQVEIGGLAAWLARTPMPPHTLRGLNAASASWDAMRRLTAVRAAHYALRLYANALTLANFHPSGAADEAESFTFAAESVWDAVKQAASAGRVGAAGCDSLGGIWIRRDYAHLNAGDRAARPVTVALTAADWRDEDGLTVETAYVRRVGTVKGRGAAWNGIDAPALYAARAPGRIAADGAAAARLPAQILPSDGAQTVLNALAGHHLAAVNAADLTIRLTHPIDALEPAWNEPVTLAWAGGGQRGTTLSAGTYLVERVEIAHGTAADQPPKVVRWRLRAALLGQPGESIPVTTPTVRPPIPPRPPSPPGGLGANTGRIALFLSDNTLRRTVNFSAASPTWTSLNLTTLSGWGAGTLQDFTVDAFSPAYVGTGTQVNGWLLTTTRVQRITDIFGSPALGTAVALAGSPFFRQMQFERGVQNWGMIAWSQYAVGVRLVYTTDGATWTAPTLPSAFNNYANNPTYGVRPGLWLDPHLAGHAVVTIYTNIAVDAGSTTAAYETFDYGATWSAKSSPTINPNNWLAGTLIVPFQDTAAARFFYGRTNLSGGAPFPHRFYRNGTDISPVVSGTAYGLTPQNESIWRRGAICDVDQNTAVLVGTPVTNSAVFGVFRTRSALASAPAWETVIAPSSSVPYRGVYIAGGDPDVWFLFGINGAIAQVTDGATVRSKKGSMTTSATVVGLCGG